MGAIFARAVLVVLAYYAGARLGQLLQFPGMDVTPFWPPAGIAVAALVLLGTRYWPALLAAGFAVNVTTGLHVAASAGIAAGNTLEYVLAAELLRRAGFQRTMSRARDVAMLAAASAIAPIVAATIGVVFLLADHAIEGTALQDVWTTFYFGDALGILVIASFLIVWRSVPARWDDQPAIETLLSVLALALLSYEIFYGNLNAAYLVFPVAIVAALRLGQRGATATAVVVALSAIAGTVRGFGPFPGLTVDRLVSLQVYLASFALTAFALAAVSAAQRDAARNASRHAKLLEATNRELEAFADRKSVV